MPPKKRSREPVSPMKPRSKARLDDDSPHQDKSSTTVPTIVVEADTGSGAHELTSLRRSPLHGKNLPSTSRESPSPHPLPQDRLHSRRAERHSLSRGSEFQIPSDITYDLYISLEESTLEENTLKVATGLTLALFEKEIYSIIVENAESHCKRNFEENCKDDEGLGDRDLFFRYGNCTILGKEGYEKRLPFRSPNDWGQIRATILLSRQRSLHLDIRLEYGAIRNSAPKGKLKSAKCLDIDALKKTALDPTEETKYVPQSDLDKVITHEVITNIINEDPPGALDADQKAAFVEEVHSKARKLFAMWVYSELPMRCLRELMLRWGLHDNDLPLKSSRPCHNTARCKLKFNSYLQTQKGFIGAQFNEVGEHQDFATHIVVPIRFCPLELARNFPTEAELPTNDEDPLNVEGTEKRQACCGKGSYSRVFRVKLDPNHHELSQDRDEYFALKEFIDRPKERDAYFRKELAILNELRRNTHDNIVTHLATWTQVDRYYMLFPYAEFNLLEFMQQNSFDAQDFDEVLWILEQIHGLASALRHIDALSDGEETPLKSSSLGTESAEKIERRASWHHDIKPENILVFISTDPPGRMFKISDWGAGKVITYRTRSPLTATPAGTQTYEPPEILSMGKISRPYDVWSLGCVFLEMLIWALCNFDTVQAFRNDRNGPREPTKEFSKDDSFWQQTSNGTMVLRKSVNTWLDSLPAQMEKDDAIAFKPVLSLDNVLHEMLNVRPSERISAPGVEDWTRRILQRYQNDTEKGRSLDPSLPRISVEPPDHRPLGPLNTGSPIAGHTNPAYTDLLFTSPSDVASPQSLRGQHTPHLSTASRSRNASNASSTLSIRGDKTKETRSDATKSLDKGQ